MPRKHILPTSHARCLAVLLFVCVTLAGCAGDQRARKPDGLCARGICGCWEAHTLRVDVKIETTDSLPVPGVALICASSQKVLGVSNQAGNARIRARGRISPGCGFIPDCEVAALEDDSGDLLGSVELTSLLRGQETSYGDLRLRIDPVTRR